MSEFWWVLCLLPSPQCWLIPIHLVMSSKCFFPLGVPSQTPHTPQVPAIPTASFHYHWCLPLILITNLPMWAFMEDTNINNILEKGTLLHCCGNVTGTTTMENNMEVPQKTKIELLYDPAILLLGIYPEKTLIWKDTCTPMFISLFTIAKTWKQTKRPNIFNEILLNHKKRKNAIWSNMDGPQDYYTKWRKSDKEDKYHMISLICRM